MIRKSVLMAVLCCLAPLLFAATAGSDEVREVDRLHRSGQTDVALQRAQKALTLNPDDTSMRFLFGVILAESQRHAEAAEVFLKLVQDFPELAESHNNLGAMHAATGDYDSARSALERAVRANPDYAVAHENLGDVYAVLAHKAYSRASRLDPGSSTIGPKLELVRELVAGKAGASRPATVAVPAPPPNQR